MIGLQKRAETIDWWHGGIDLGRGVTTKGQTNPADALLPRLDLPSDLTGKSVLDICSWDGYMAFECERRGAARVVATDSYAWEKPDRLAPWHKTGRDGFDLAHSARGSRVEPIYCDVMDLEVDLLGTFDIVLFLGVLYHLRHPLLALERIAPLVGDLLIVETYSDLRDVAAPAMRFYPGDEVNRDATNWWGPNPACVRAMLQDVGFEVTQVSPESAPRAVVHAKRSGGRS